MTCMWNSLRYSTLLSAQGNALPSEPYSKIIVAFHQLFQGNKNNNLRLWKVKWYINYQADYIAGP